MKNETNIVTVKLLGVAYQVKCSEEQRPAVLAAAELLDKNMYEVKAAGKLVQTERIAILAALNLAHESLTLQETKETATRALNQKMNTLQGKVEEALHLVDIAEV